MLKWPHLHSIYTLRTVFEAVGKSPQPIKQAEFIPPATDSPEGVTEAARVDRRIDDLKTGNHGFSDTNSAQRLSEDTIMDFRARGVDGSKIIQALVENSDSWNVKPEFSKEKYLKKKQQKSVFESMHVSHGSRHMPRVRVLKSTPNLLCDIYLSRPARIWYLSL